MALVLVSGVAVLTPRAAHAVVATFVRDVDNAARHRGREPAVVLQTAIFPIAR